MVIAFRADAIAPRSATERRSLPFPGDPRWAALIWQAGRLRRLEVPASERSIWTARLELLGWELESERLGSQQAARAVLTNILIATARAAFPSGVDAAAAVDPSALEVLDVIEQSYAEHLSLDVVARQVGRSPRHLTRLMRQLTGETVMYWIDERRMEEARRLLLESLESVESIAARVGYPDAGYFRRRFRRAHGLAPREWRRNSSE